MPEPARRITTCLITGKGNRVIWFMVCQVVSMLVELVRLGRKSERDKDLEILLLRRQLRMVERNQSERTRGSDTWSFVSIGARDSTRSVSWRMHGGCPTL